MKPILLTAAAFAAALIAVFSAPQPSVAQESSDLYNVIFNEHALQFPVALAHGVAAHVYHEPTPNENGLEQAPRTQFRIGGVDASSFPIGVVEFYRLDEISGSQADTSFRQVRRILDERPDLAEYLARTPLLPTAFPFIEMPRAGHTFSTREAYFESEDYSGIISINARIYNLSSGVVFMRYNLEAISHDGVWGLSAHFDLRADHPKLDDFLGNEELYAQEVIAYLSSTPADEFTPSLDPLDQILASVRLIKE